jgi:thioredoxin-like negative regulator of GroEL
MLWKRRRGDAPEPLTVVLYTRERCCLCDAMKAAIEQARSADGVPFELREVDIDTDPALVERYGLSIPVLEIDGRAAFKGRLSAEAFTRKLARRAAARGPA